MRVCLFENRAENLDPLSLTRPVFHLVCGRTCLASKQLRYWAPREYGLLIRQHLEELERLPAIPVNDQRWLGAGPTLFVNGRWLPPEGQPTLPDGPCIGLVDGEVAFAMVGAEDARNVTAGALPDLLEEWRNRLPAHAAGGDMVRYPWDLVEQNGPQLGRDFKALRRAEARPVHPAHVALVGPAEDLWVDPRARIDPYVVADTTNGPIVIDAHAVVTAFSRLEGPCYIGSSTQVHAAKIRAGTTLGPQCRVGGEVEASVLLGYSNKYHDGFLGHSYVGEWVNLGAGTHNSDLRNDYGEVTVTIHGRAVPTGLSKIGCFLGDHTKTGLGTLLNTGTNVGAFCNLLPAGRFAPKYVPSFTDWWNGELREGMVIDQMLNTARIVMQRRGVFLTESQVELYQSLRRETAAERHRVIRESGQRLLRRSA